MVAYKAEFNRILICELEYNSVVNVDSKAPDIMSFWMEFFCSEYGIERVLPEKLRFLICFALDFFRKVKEKFIKCGSGIDFYHVF